MRRRWTVIDRVMLPEYREAFPDRPVRSFRTRRAAESFRRMLTHRMERTHEMHNGLLFAYQVVRKFE